MTKRAVVIGLVFSTLVFRGAKGTTWYVDGSVAVSGDGHSWQTAFRNIREGIYAATHGDTVIVAEGIYVENVHFNGKNIALQSTNPSDPFVVENTIIDGGQLGSVVTFAGTEDETCSLRGFTIRNGRADHGAGICGGTWGNPTLARIVNNIIVDNIVPSSVGGEGGGLYYCNGRIQGNVIRGNSCDSLGGGLCECHGVIQNNIIMENEARLYGGGLCFCDATIKNNLVCENTGGGLVWCNGTIQNNTIVRNSGQGISECLGTIRNCIIWGNTSSQGLSPELSWLENAQLFESNMPTYSCIQDWNEGGEGNITEDPQFVDAENGDFRLQEGSPCVDAALNYYWFHWPERDIEGNCRLSGERVDMGCYEYGASKDSDGDILCDAHEGEAGTDPYSDDTDGDSLRDGLEVLRGCDPLSKTPPTVVHVPFDAPSIQQCLCLAISGEEIVVAPGTYYENLQFCGVDVVLRSAQPENPDIVASTILDGAAGKPIVLWPFDSSGRGPVVSFAGHESTACVLAGFTIRNGKSSGGGGIRGGPPACHTLATIQQNVITENSAPGTYGYGGGLVFCDGLITGNIITGNTAERHAGLSHCGGVIESNVISCNSGWDTGGGLTQCHGLIRNNLIVGNTAGGYGGGLYECNARIENNTICRNKAHEVGGLQNCKGTVRNCIIWGNTGGSYPQFYGCPTLTYCCIQGSSNGGGGNISLDPRFVDPDGEDDDPETYGDNDYRLLPDSPCIDSGENMDWMWEAADLDGNKRIANDTVDMGALEFGADPLFPPRLYVDVRASGANNGTSWTDAFVDLQDALDLAATSAGAVTEIWVAAGTYTPAQGTGDREATFQLVTGVALYGGFAGDETDLDQRDFAANETILSGDLNGDDGPDFANNEENSYHVVSGGGTYETAVLDGFTITGGNHDRGGGMYNWQGSPTVRNCVFTDNSAGFGGGGGMYNADNSNPTVTNCTFSDNRALLDWGGGGMCNYGSSPTLTNCTFTRNLGEDNGGGLDNWEGSNPTLIGCVFFDNRSGSGGGVHCYGDCILTLIHCTFAANTAGLGGGLGVGFKCGAVMVGCVFHGNSASEGGGVRASHQSSITLTNCTLTANSAGAGGGVYIWHGAALTLTNCILWDNRARRGKEVAVTSTLDPSAAEVSCSDVRGGEAEVYVESGCTLTCGPGNMSAYPLLTAEGRLLPTSPCIDAGDNAAVPDSVVTDLCGNPRIINGAVDMGAFEFQSVPWVTITEEEDAARLDWGEFGDGHYTVEWTEELVDGTWQEAPGTWPLTDLMWTDIVTAEIMQRFYRLVSAGIYSDPVGFVKVVPVKDGLTMLSIPLIPADNRLNGNPGCIGDMIAKSLTGGADPGDADMLWKWKARTQSYQAAYLLAGVDEGYGGEWWDNDAGDFSTMIIDAGECFWVLKRTRTAALP